MVPSPLVCQAPPSEIRVEEIKGRFK